MTNNELNVELRRTVSAGKANRANCAGGGHDPSACTDVATICVWILSGVSFVIAALLVLVALL